VLDQLRRIHAEARTVVLVTHSLDAARGADRRVILRSGKLSEEPSPSPTGPRWVGPAGSGLG
jgi:ABC-type lipoprotein export system ATPase subunit